MNPLGLGMRSLLLLLSAASLVTCVDQATGTEMWLNTLWDPEAKCSAFHPSGAC